MILKNGWNCTVNIRLKAALMTSKREAGHQVLMCPFLPTAATTKSLPPTPHSDFSPLSTTFCLLHVSHSMIQASTLSKTSTPSNLLVHIGRDCMVTYLVADAILQLLIIKLFLSSHYFSKMFPGGE